LASGIVSAAFPLGQAIFLPVAAILVAVIGWRLGYIALGLALFAMLPLVVLFLREEPRPGEVPASERPPGATAHGGRGTTSPGYTLRQAMGTRAFWLILVSQVSCGLVDQVVGLHLIPFVSDEGRSELFAASVMGATSLVAAVGSVAGGWVSDRFGRKLALIAMHGLRAVSIPLLVLFALSGQDFWLFLFVPLYGATIIVGFPATSTLIARLYGPRSLATVYGNLQLTHHLGMAAGGYVAGVIFDHAGSYFPAFALATGIAAFAMLCLFWLNEKQAG
jgi:MFS family permease